MKKYAPETETEAEESDFKPLTAEQAQQWRQRNPQASPWRLLAWQVLLGVAVSLLAWAVSGRPEVGWSAAYGALAVVLPAALFARGLARQSEVTHAGAAMVGFFGWELAKLLLSIAMLAMAARLVKDLSWLALLVGMVVTLKTYWIALLVQRANVRKTD